MFLGFQNELQTNYRLTRTWLIELIVWLIEISPFEGIVHY